MVVIDEMADLVTSGGAEVAQSITRLTQRGREAGIHVIGCTQKPTVEAIGSLVKSNFPVRLVGSVASAEDGRVATGLKASGAEKLMGRGDFLLVIKGEVVRFQAAYISPEEVESAAAMLRQSGRAGRRWPAEGGALPAGNGVDTRTAACLPARVPEAPRAGTAGRAAIGEAIVREGRMQCRVAMNTGSPQRMKMAREPLPAGFAIRRPAQQTAGGLPCPPAGRANPPGAKVSFRVGHQDIYGRVWCLCVFVVDWEAICVAGLFCTARWTTL